MKKANIILILANKPQKWNFKMLAQEIQKILLGYILMSY